jgi:hypothetical protein|tara:strand:+ start:1335 stop:1517 length:183 start_codon:yes stop_codon:yes gene_type:complete
MKFGVAVKRSITSFLDGSLPEKMIEQMGGEVTYTLQYFEDLEKNLELGLEEEGDDDEASE